MMIAARNSFLMSGTQPYKRQLPYLHIGNGQYIAPNWIINQPTDDFDTITAKIKVTALTAKYDCYFGGSNGSYSTSFRRYSTGKTITTTTSFRKMQNGNIQYSSWAKRLPTSDFENVGFDLSGIFWGTERYSFGNGNQSYTIPLAIGANYYGGEIIQKGSEFDLASFSVYARGTILAHDLIPVLDLNDTPCFYDQVTGESWYNAGSGTLGVPP